MILDNIVNGIINTDRRLYGKFSHLYYASTAFLLVKALDIVSTSIYMHKTNDMGLEKNIVARYAMEHLGIDAGLLLLSIPLMTLAIEGGYILNKLYKNSNNKILRNIGTVEIYGIAIYEIPILINNYSILLD